MTDAEATLEQDGLVWTRQADRNCIVCCQRTYRMCARTRNELLWARWPGPQGAHTFTSQMSAARVFVVCDGCLSGRFQGDRRQVLWWDKRTQGGRVVRSD